MRVGRVAGGRVGEVVELHGEGPFPVFALAEFGLGAVAIFGSRIPLDRQVDGRGSGCLNVGDTGALLAHGIVAGIVSRLVHGLGRAHQEQRDQVALFVGANVAELGILREVLRHLRGDARHLRRRHRGAGHVAVRGGTARVGAVDVAAGGGDFGLYLHLGRGAPAGKGAHGVIAEGRVRRHGILVGGDGGDALFHGARHLAAVLQADADDRHREALAQSEVSGDLGDVVVDDDGGGLHLQEVLRLGLEGERRAVGAAALHEHDLARKRAVVG